MWQVAVAAAVAGSGLVAQHLFSPITTTTTADNQHLQPEIDEQPPPQAPLSLQFSSPSPTTPLVSSPPSERIDHVSAPNSLLGAEREEEKDCVFNFSTSDSGNRGGFWFDSEKSRVLAKNCKFHRRAKKNFRRSEAGGSNLGKKVVVCLKKRKTGRCDGSCCTKDSSFDCGLGLGIAYMMSASKAEIKKLSNAVDETAKVVDELKSELCKRKSSHHEPPSITCPDHSNLQTHDYRQLTKAADAEPSRLSKGHNDIKGLSPCITDDGEYASSVLTEEPHPESMEMDQLEAELESELEKLPWCFIEDSNQVENRRANIEMQGSQGMENHNFSDPCINGVPPYLLNQKLSSVLIKQQESRILELETELTLANSKLREKESELQALKDCVRHLTEFSLSTASDDETGETETFAERGSMTKQGSVEEYGSPNPTAVGKKRSMDFGSYSF